MPAAPDFAARVFDIVGCIPRGRVSTYGMIAAAAGHKGAARTVGWLLHATKTAAGELPAHRVVNRNGYLTGHHHFGPGQMARLLEFEGIVIQDNRVQNFSTVCWNPLEELSGSF